MQSYTKLSALANYLSLINPNWSFVFCLFCLSIWLIVSCFFNAIVLCGEKVHGTGWCIVERGRAENLCKEGGDIYLCSNDRLGVNACIRIYCFPNRFSVVVDVVDAV